MSPQVFKKSDLTEALWSVAPAGGLLRIRQSDKVTINFHGFAKGDEGRLKDSLSSKLDLDLMSQPMHLSGHNWGSVKVHGSSVAFEVPTLVHNAAFAPGCISTVMLQRHCCAQALLCNGMNH